MSDVPIWRYLSLAKYIDLLRTRSLFFPKAALFQDETEGKWFGHTILCERTEHWRQAEENARMLEGLLDRAGHNPLAIYQEAQRLLADEDGNFKGNMRDVLRGVGVGPPDKWRAYLELLISSWRKHYDEHGREVETWTSQISIHRESTYISCWNRASSMSLAMWDLYGGSREAIAVRSTASKLNALLEYNSSFLERQSLEGGVVEVQYVGGLKNPDEQVHDSIYEIISGSPNVALGMFSIKPSLYEFEREVRAIIFPKRDIFEPLKDPHPNVSGFALQVGRADSQEEPSVSSFIDAVYVHPTLSSGSMMIETVKEVNRLFGVAEIPIIADRIEAFGQNISLPPLKP
jgi:hypothetical protein